MQKSLMISLAVLFVMGCANQDRYLKAEIGMHVPLSVTNIPVEEDLDDFISVSIIRPNGEIVKNGNKKKQAIYYSVDITKLLAQPKMGLTNATQLKVRRNQIIDIMMFVSDWNTETYLSRAFAANLYIRGFRGVLDRSFTALQTGTALISPESSAALGLSNLLVGGIGDEYASLVFAEKTFEALQNAIQAERAELKLKLINAKKLKYEEYSMQSALSDLRKLAEATSIRTGVNRLVAMSESQLGTAQNKLDVAERKVVKN